MNSKRTLELSHEEIELIEIALERVGVDLSKRTRLDEDLISKDIRGAIFERSLEFMDLKYKINNGEKDV